MDALHREVRASGKTAMARPGLSAPVRWLLQNGCIPKGARVLDMGCGRGADVQGLQVLGCPAFGWDPVHRPDTAVLADEYDVVLSIYVFNTLPPEWEDSLLYALQARCKPGGRVYIAVRRDAANFGTRAGVYQRVVTLPLVSVYCNKSFEIYTCQEATCR